MEMKRSEVLFGILRILGDACAIASALILAHVLRMRNIDLLPGIQLLEEARTLPDLKTFIRTFVPPTVLLFIFVASFLKLYRIRVTLSFFREFSRLALSVVIWVGAIMGWYFFVRKQLFYSRALLLQATLFAGAFLTLGRILLMLVQRALLKRGIGVRTVLSLGSQALPGAVLRVVSRDPRYRYLGHISSFHSLDSSPDLLLQTDPSSSEETNRVIDFCRSHHIGYAFLPPVLIDVPHLLSVYRFGTFPILRFHPTPLDGWGAIYKRTADFSIALLLLVLLSPLLLLIALLIIIDSRGPVFYRHKRISQGGRSLIPILKFRSMVKDAEKKKEELSPKNLRTDGPLFKIKNDPRITRVGRLLRRFSLDELPQLWNVLRGDLSLVGPRPHLPEEVARYTDFQRRVFAVKPGITGLAQISGRSDLKFEDEVRLDLQYIEEWSPWLDLFIFWRTIWVVLRGEGAD